MRVACHGQYAPGRLCAAFALHERDSQQGHRDVCTLNWSAQEDVRLMRVNNIRAAHGYRTHRQTSTKRAAPIPNALKRPFDVLAPNKAWVTQIRCAAASGVGDGRCHSKEKSRPPASGLQGQVANHGKRLGSKALVVSVAEKVPVGIR